MRKGFTLIELIIVVIIIGILATVAVPQYLRATERAEGGRARNSMALIAQGEKLFRAEMDRYIVVANNAANATLGNFVELNEVDADTRWSYVVAPGATGIVNSFIITARRVGGANNDETITLNQNGLWVPAIGTVPGAGQFSP